MRGNHSIIICTDLCTSPRPPTFTWRLVGSCLHNVPPTARVLTVTVISGLTSPWGFSVTLPVRQPCVRVPRAHLSWCFFFGGGGGRSECVWHVFKTQLPTAVRQHFCGCQMAQIDMFGAKPHEFMLGGQDNHTQTAIPRSN